jgi:hypothetical protein
MLALITAGLAGINSASNWLKARSVADKRSSLPGMFSALAILLLVIPDIVSPLHRLRSPAMRIERASS